jgi:flagellar basal body L-ring protein FlgH
MNMEPMIGRRPARWAAWTLALWLAGCIVPSQPGPMEGEGPPGATVDKSLRQQAREQPPIRTTTNLYEGSLWRGTSSWGNLMRDHRARFTGDLLTVRELSKIINVPEVVSPAKPGVVPAAQAPAAPGAVTPPEEEQIELPKDPVLRFLEEQRRRRQEIEKEQAEILRSLDQVEVQVIRVLQNGNLLVRGTHSPIFRDNNRVKYLFSINGIVRPADVDDNNTISSTKLGKAEYKLARLVRRPDILPGAFARALGAPREGALLDRFTDFLTTPAPSQVGTAR